MNFGYLYIRSPNGKTPWKKSLRQILLPTAASSKTTSKKAPPGGETPCLWRTEKPQNCTPKMPNVTSETHRKWCFWLLFPLAAAMNFGYLFLLLLQRLLLLLRLVSGWKNTMEKITSRKRNTIPLKDGEAPKLHPENAQVTSETHRKWCFWFLFPLAAAMNFSYLYIRSPNGKTPWKKFTSRGRNTMPLKDGEAPNLHPENA